MTTFEQLTALNKEIAESQEIKHQQLLKQLAEKIRTIKFKDEK